MHVLVVFKNLQIINLTKIPINITELYDLQFLKKASFFFQHTKKQTKNKQKMLQILLKELNTTSDSDKGDFKSTTVTETTLINPNDT